MPQAIQHFGSVTNRYGTISPDLGTVTAHPIAATDLLMVQDFVIWMQSWGASPATIAHRTVVIHAMIRRCGPPAGITAAILADWLATPGLSPWSRRTYYNHARAFFQWAVKTSRLEVDPTEEMRRPVVPRGVPRPFQDHELALIQPALSGNLRDFFTLGWCAGLRAHEIAKIRGEDVNARTLYVKGKGGHEAHLPTHPEIWELAQRKPSRGYWFPSNGGPLPHLASQSVSRMASRFLSELGIDGSIHRARHTYATRLLRQGTNIRVVQQLMRHQTLSSTELYLGVEDDELSRAIAGLVA